MNLKFSDLKYERPDFSQLSHIYQELMGLLKPKKPKLQIIKQTFELFSEQYINFISMQNLSFILSAQNINKVYYEEENLFFNENMPKVQELYYSMFSKLADLNINFDEDSLEKSSILNQARRIARTYGKIDADLLSEEIKLIAKNDHLMDSIIVEINTVEPGLYRSEERIYKSYKVYLNEFENWLKQGNSRARSQLYYKFSQELQTHAAENLMIFQNLVENRKKQAKQSNLSFYNFVIDRSKGYGYKRTEVLAFKKNLVKYFLPIIEEIRNLRNERLEFSDPLFYDEYKISEKNQLSLFKKDISIPKTVLKTIQNIFGREESHINQIISGEFWSVNKALQRKSQKDVLLLPKWNALYLFLPLQQDVFVLENVFFSIGKALSDLSGMINLQGLATYEQSDLIRIVTGIAIEFLSMREIDLFVGQNAVLFNDLSITYELLKIPRALAIDTFESTVYSAEETGSISYSELWKQIEQNYNLDFNYGSDGFFSAGHGWQLYQEVFHKPFSSLDRAMALIIILAERPHRDRRNSLETKLNKLLTSNTDLPFLKRLEISGFSSPFEVDTIRRASFAACDILKL